MGSFRRQLIRESLLHLPSRGAGRHRRARGIPAALAVFALAWLPAHANGIFPVAFPDPAIPGFAFPESEATLTRWITQLTRARDANVAADAFENIHRHGWGLWTALTLTSGQVHEGHRLRVFETWLAPDDLLSTAPNEVARLSARPARRAALRQLAPMELRADLSPLTEPRRASAAAVSDRVLGFVKFDPTAAEHIVRQRLLHREALDDLLAGGAQGIPPFPATALAIKPLFQIIRRQALVEGRYHALKAWPGPPPAPRPWAPAHWPASVWIDVLDGGTGRGGVDPIALFDGSTRTEDNTYPLSSFIHYRLSAADAAALDEGGQPATEGDIAILVAMHVSGREIARWTWQTFWWAPDPDNPAAPSSPAIASLRPHQLTGAARHYALALAYTMLSPDEPYVGGRNAAPAVYAYNPWLEARLGPSDLPDSAPGLGPDGLPAANNHGVQSNCMSCHAHANYNPQLRATAPGFTGARYVDLGAAEFVGTLQLDFLWTLGRHAR